MALSQPRTIYGVHSVCFYDRDDGTPISILKILGEVSMNFSAESEELRGGSNLYLWDSEVKSIPAEISLTAREYNPATMAMLLAGTLTENASEATGAIDEFANVYGTSISNSTTGIAGITVTSAEHTDLKSGKYIIKVTAADEFDVYCLSDVDFQNGVNGSYVDDTLKITSSPLDISLADVELADYGITFTKGSGTIAMTIGDTAEFYVRKVNAGSTELLFGESGSVFSKVGVILYGAPRNDGSIQGLELYRCSVAGMPISFSEGIYSEWNVTAKVEYDSARNATGKYFDIIGV